ncbi:MAG TPA: hypothetical protein VMF51_08350 [Nocardioides sp.]|nr:hypothetical protein [Nocardioides sp.]
MTETERTTPAPEGATCTPWCRDHQDPDQDGGWCSTGSIIVNGLDGIGVSIENSWGQPKLYGLAGAEADCLTLQGARELRDALVTLVGLVDPVGKPEAAEPAATPPSAPSSCGRPWCNMDQAPLEHESYHAGDAVDLADWDDEHYTGWSGWLVEDVGGPLKVNVEGVVSEGRFDAEIDAVQVWMVLQATATPEAREALTALLSGVVDLG